MKGVLTVYKVRCSSCRLLLLQLFGSWKGPDGLLGIEESMTKQEKFGGAEAVSAPPLQIDKVL